MPRKPPVGKQTPEPVILTTEQREAFLAAVHENPGAGHIATLRRLGIPGTRAQLHQIVADQLKTDIETQRGDQIRSTILARAIIGIQDPVYTPSGKLAGYKTVYSDRLLDLAAKMWLEEGQPRVNIGNADGKPFQTVSGQFDWSKLTPEERTEARELLTRVSELGKPDGE